MFIDIHTHIPQKYCQKVVQVVSLLLHEEPFEQCGILFSQGLHPWSVEMGGNYDFLPLKSSKIIAVGEIGVDKLYPNFERQIQLFEMQILEAIKMKKPIIIHSVKAFEEVFALLRRYISQLEGVIIHSFVGNTIQAQRLVELGCFLSFSPTSLASSRSIEALKSLSLEDIFIESDSSGRSIIEIYSLVAQYKNIEIGEVEKVIEKNFKKIFNELV